MGEGRCVLLATVLEVHNSIPFYPYCQRCYSKLDYKSNKTLWQCSQCSNRVKNMDVMYRFRLSLTIADRQGVADISIFGQCLDTIFGSTANKFQKYLKHVEDSHPEVDANHLVHSAESNSLNGNQFYFGFKVMFKAANRIEGLNDLLQHHLKTNKPRGIVACQAIQPFQNSQNLSVIQFVKHSIHCLSKSAIVTSLCSISFCYCKCNEENKRKQSFRKSATFVCSGSSTGSNTQRKLSTNSFGISYEESLNANSQRLTSQESTSSDIALYNVRNTLQITKQVNEEDFQSYTLTNGAENEPVINKNLNDKNDKCIHQVEGYEISTAQDGKLDTNSTFSDKADGSIDFPDDLPFSEDLQLFLEKVDTKHAEESIPSQNACPQKKELIKSNILSEQQSNYNHAVANVSNLIKTELPFMQTSRILSEQHSETVEKVQAKNAEGNILIPDASLIKKGLRKSRVLSEHHSSINFKHTVTDVSNSDNVQNEKELPCKTSRMSSEQHCITEAHPGVYQTLNHSERRESDITNLNYFNELPFSEDIEMFLQHLENYHEDKSVLFAKSLYTNSENVSTNKENNSHSQLKRDNSIVILNMERESKNHPLHSLEMTKPCTYSTPIQSVVSKTRTNLRQHCKRILHCKQELIVVNDHQQEVCLSNNQPETAKESSSKKNSVLFESSDLGNDINRMEPEEPLDSKDLFSQSLFSPRSFTTEKPLKKRTISHSNDLSDRNEHTVYCFGKSSTMNRQSGKNGSPKIAHQTLQPCRFSTPKYQNAFQGSSVKDSSKESLIKRINSTDNLQYHSPITTKTASHKKTMESDTSKSRVVEGDIDRNISACLLSDCSPDLFSSQSIFIPSSVKKIGKKSLKKTRSLSKDLMERMLKLKQSKSKESYRKQSYKSCLAKNTNAKSIEVDDVAQTSDLNSSDIFTQPLFDSYSETSESCHLTERMLKLKQSARKDSYRKPSHKSCLKSIKNITKTKRREVDEANGLSGSDIFTQPLFDTSGESSEILDPIANSFGNLQEEQDDANLPKIIKTESNEMFCCSPDVFSHSFLNSASKVYASPDLFSSWCDDPNRKYVFGDVYSDDEVCNSVQDYEDSVSMQLFTSTDSD